MKNVTRRKDVYANAIQSEEILSVKEQSNVRAFLLHPVLYDRKYSLLEGEGESVIQRGKLSPRRRNWLSEI